MKNANIVTLILGLLAVGKVIFNAFGYPFIDDKQWNELANGLATVISILAVFYNHFKPPVSDEKKIDNIKY